MRPDEGREDGFGPLSATALVTVRQRLNMNAIRVRLDAGEDLRSQDYRARADRVLHLANDLELLAIVDGDPDERFWTQLAARLKDEPNVFFAPLRPELAAAIRSAGAKQPVIVEGGPAMTGVIEQATPRYADSADAWNRMRIAAQSRPVLADDFDPRLDAAGGECAAFPGDPAEATRLVESKLEWFDQQTISWTLSSFTAGRLITDYQRFNGTKLDDGWTCGTPGPVAQGLGLAISSHLWRTKPLGLFIVSLSRGGIALARGGLATGYGPILADQTMSAREPLPVELGNISVRITDSRGVSRLAPLLYTGAGWGFISFIVPEECATGLATVEVVRKDGSSSGARVLIGDVAPALLTATADGRGAAIAWMTQDGKSRPVWNCDEGCRGLPIPLAAGVETTVRLLGSGFRNARNGSGVRAIAGGMAVPVVSMGPSTEPANDQLTIRLPDQLIGAGMIDFYFIVDGELSNVVRIDCGRRL